MTRQLLRIIASFHSAIRDHENHHHDQQENRQSLIVIHIVHKRILCCSNDRSSTVNRGPFQSPNERAERPGFSKGFATNARGGAGEDARHPDGVLYLDNRAEGDERIYPSRKIVEAEAPLQARGKREKGRYPMRWVRSHPNRSTIRHTQCFGPPLSSGPTPILRRRRLQRRTHGCHRSNTSASNKETAHKKQAHTAPPRKSGNGIVLLGESISLSTFYRIRSEWHK